MKQQQTIFFRLIHAIAVFIICLSIPAFSGIADSSPMAARLSDPPADVPDDWLSAAQKNIEKSEYHVTWQEKTCLPELAGALQAPNRAHNLRTYFTKKGIRVVPRTSAKPEWEWGLRLERYGYRENMKDLAPVKPSADGNKVEYQRDCILEWYVNDPKGLEQGFTLLSPPEKGHGKLALQINLSGNLIGSLNSSTGNIEFVTPGGVGVIHFGKLLANDAEGKTLTSEFVMTPKGFYILVDSKDAVYPIVVDPLATSPAWTGESNQAHAYFGKVSTAGDVNGDGYSDVIIGAYAYDNDQANEGRVYLYYGSATGLSTTPNWTTEGNQNDGFFGSKLGTAGDVNGDGYSDIIIGAKFYDNGQEDEGIAYVYHGSASGLSTSPDWTAESDQAFAEFGVSVNTAGDVNGDGYSDVIIGAWKYDNDQVDEGKVFIYYGSASGLSTNANWTVEGNQDGAVSFGMTVGTAGDINGDGYDDVFISASEYDNDQIDDGVVFVYHGSLSGPSTSPDWFAEGDYERGCFGHDVGTAGDINGDGYSDIIIGEIGYASQPAWQWEGRAYVYHGSATGLSDTPNWTAEANQDYAYFYRVGSAGDVNGDGYSDIIIGATRYDNGQTDEGRAYVHFGSASGLSNSPDWTGEGNQADAHYGRPIGTAGDVNGDGYSDIIIGASKYDNGQTDEGRAYVYYGGPSTLSETPVWAIQGNQTDMRLGGYVGTAGDVNGDGFSDVIVNAHSYDNGQENAGAAFVYYGTATGLPTVPNWSAEGDQAFARFAICVESAGDVNGDGYSDIAIGAQLYDNGQTDEGRAFIYHGSATGLLSSPSWTAEGDQDGAEFGFRITTAGDVNGDGYSDVIVGAHLFDNGQTDEGAAFVYYGSPTGLLSSPSWSAEGDQISADFGYSVGTAGDINGDGYSDIIVGARHYDNGQADEGIAFAYYGSETGLSMTPDWTDESDQNSARFGTCVASAGDVNGDGYTDIIIGANHYDNGQENEGIAFVYYGSASGISASPNWTAESDQALAYLGYSVGTAGDVNGDGFGDVIIGIFNYTNGQTNEGAAFLYCGSTSGLSLSPDWTTESNMASATLGESVGTAGDVNGDGYSDVIAGAKMYNYQTEGGRVFLFYGNATSGLSLTPQQRRTDDTAPIAQLGLSDQSDQFSLSVLGRTPYGRGKVKLEWEVKPNGTPFDGTGTQKSTGWLDTGTAGAAIDELVQGLTVGNLYHWRMRLLYHPVTTPFQQYSRWFSSPANVVFTGGGNSAPVITGQNSVSTSEGTPITITFNDLLVTDTDNPYPTGFTLTVQDGTGYSRNDATITPNIGFTGTLTVPVFVNDGSADSNTFDLSVTVFKATLTGTPTSPTNQTTATLTVGGDLVTHYRYKLNAGAYGTETTVATPISLSGLASGTHTVSVIGRNAAGVWQSESQATSGTWTVDITPPNPPNVIGTTPTNDTTPTWSWSGGGGGNGMYRYNLNNGTWSAETTATTYTHGVALMNGTYTLYVQERDTVMNWSLSGTHSIVVDTQGPNPPNVTGTTPTNDTTPTWTWNSGGGGAGLYRYNLNGGPWSAETGLTNYTSATPLTDNTYTLCVQEKDGAGNWSPSGCFAITVITTAPVIITPSILNISEPDGTAAFIVRLFKAPTASVTLALTSGCPDRFTLSQASVTLDSGNWSAGIPVTVQTTDDFAINVSSPNSKPR